MLYLVSTPIGNLEDISQRAIRILKEADVVLCEDTRKAGMFLKGLGIPPKRLVSFYDEVEAKRVEEMEALLQSDLMLALISEAGTPLVSDPGYKLVRRAIELGAKVSAVPGPSAVVTALTLSGLPPDKWLFLGFLPEKESHAVDILEKVKKSGEILPVTVIFYASPYKIRRNMETIKNVFEDIEIVLLREMTKIYEERWSGRITDFLEHFKNFRGEFVVLFNLREN